MVLDETLRNRIDAIARRRKNRERILAGMRGTFAMLASYTIIRLCIGIMSGGQGGTIAFTLALATGITYALSAPRHHHTRLTAARYVDTQLHLEDRLATAVEHATLDNAAANLVEACLFADAAKQANRIDPNQLVPYTLPAKTRLLIPLAILCVAVSLPIYPKGFTWQFGGTRLQQAAKRADELTALADQLSRMDPQQPQLQQLANSLRNAGDQLRNKRLSQNDARKLLNELEQELQQRPIGAPGEGQSELDLAQIQSLANRIRAIENPELLQMAQQTGLSSGGARSGAGQNGSRPNGETSDGESTSGSGGNGRSSQSRSNSGSGDNEDSGNDENDGQGNSTGNGRSPSASGSRSTGNANSQLGDSNNNADNAGADGTDENEGSGDGTNRTGSQAGTQRGSDTRMQDYQRTKGSEQQPSSLSGKASSAGQLYSSNMQSSTAPGKTATKKLAGSSAALSPGAVERAVVQENIPLAYRKWIKDYFAQLEPGSTK